MKHEALYPSAARGRLFVCMFVGLVLLASCSSHREVTHVADTHTVEHMERTDTTSRDTAAVDTRTAALRVDSARVEAYAADTIKIDRDSLGLPWRIVWLRSFDFTGTGTEYTRGHQSQTSTAATAKTTGAATSDTTGTTAETVEQQARKGIPLETMIGAPLLLFVILYVIYRIIEVTWLENRKK